MGGCPCYFVSLRVCYLRFGGPVFDNLGGKAYIIISTKISGGKPLFLLVAVFPLRLTTSTALKGQVKYTFGEYILELLV